ISGIVIPLSMIKDNYTINKFPQFFGKRITRIEPPYLISLILVVLYTHIRNYIPGVNPVDLRPDVSDIFLHIGYLVPFVKGSEWLLPVYWTLAIEFQYYLLMSLIFPLIYKNMYSRTICFFILLVGAYFFNNMGFIFVWLPLFIMGIYTALYKVGR